MIIFTFLFQVLSLKTSQIDKTIYLIEGEQYKVNLDSLIEERYENNYSFVSQNKGFILDDSNLKLKSDIGVYSIQPTRLLRERQHINLEDYQGTGQFGILDEHDSGHRICYNSNAIINLDQCIDLDNTATNYDFVFIARDTIAVSKVRLIDQYFGVTLYQNKEIISELYFAPSKTYTHVKRTIIEYSRFQKKNYLLFGVTEEDSNIEFLEVQENFQIVNTNKVISKEVLIIANSLHLYDMKGTVDKVYIILNTSDQGKVIISLKYLSSWKINLSDYSTSHDFRGLELGYNFIEQTLAQTHLICFQKNYNIRSTKNVYTSDNFYKQVKSNALVKYTLNYLIVYQDNQIFVSSLYKSVQRTNIITQTILQIDVDFQNDILIVFTDAKILQYYLKQADLYYSSNTITQSLDLVTIKAVSIDQEQVVNIYFQVLSKDDYNPYLSQDLSKDLYCNTVFYSPKNRIPLNGISGPDIRVDGIVDDYVEIRPQYLDEYGINIQETFIKNVILEQLLTNYQNPSLFRQFDDFSFSIYDCISNKNSYDCSPEFNNTNYSEKVAAVQYHQGGQKIVQYALLNENGLQIYVFNGTQLNAIVQTLPEAKFIDMKVGTDRLFVYTINNHIIFYSFTSGEYLYDLDLLQFGQSQGQIVRKLWVNQVKTNLIVISYGEDLIIGRFTSQFNFIQRITIKWVVDVAIVADNNFIVLQTDKTNQRLTQYFIEDETFTIKQELDPHGYEISGNNLSCDYVLGTIIVQAQKEQQRVLLIYGDTELIRDSLLKVIELQEDEFAENVIFNQQMSILLKGTTDPKKNSSIIQLSQYQLVETKLTRIPDQFSQLLSLKYIFGNQFSQSIVERMRHLYLEYEFYNITTKHPSNTISYKDDNLLKIPIKPDSFQGQVRTLKLTQNEDNIKLTTRFKNKQPFVGIPQSSKCKQIVSFDRLLCIKGTNVTYHDITGNILSQVSLQNITTTDLKQLILHYDDLYALVQSTEQIMLIYILQNEIKYSEASYKWEIPLDNYIFYKEWLVLYYSYYLRYFRFQTQSNNLWRLDQLNQFLMFGMQQIQYDPITEQIFSLSGYNYLSYFRSSLEDVYINQQTVNYLNMAQFLFSQQIYQLDTQIENIKIITQKQQSYLFVSTKYGNILNMTIQSDSQEFKVNNLYIVNGPSPQVQDIQLIDDYVLVQNLDAQFLYKNTHDWKLDKPYLILEGIEATNFMGLFKKGSQIIHIYCDRQGMNYYQSNIDDDIFLTVSDLKSFRPGNLAVEANNGYGQAKINFQIVKSSGSSNAWIWIVISIIIVIAIATGGYYCYKKNRQSYVDPLLV